MKTGTAVVAGLALVCSRVALTAAQSGDSSNPAAAIIVVDAGSPDAAATDAAAETQTPAPALSDVEIDGEDTSGPAQVIVAIPLGPGLQSRVLVMKPTCTQTFTVPAPTVTDCVSYASTTVLTAYTNCGGCALTTARADGEWRPDYLFNGQLCGTIEDIDETVTKFVVSCGVVPPSALVVPVVTGTGVYVPPPPTDQATATKGLTWEESPADLFRPIQLAVDQCCGTRPITSLGCTRECVNAAADQNRADQCNDMCTWGRAASGVCYDNCLARYALRDYIPSYIEVSSE